jgi:hypothetical protein
MHARILLEETGGWIRGNLEIDTPREGLFKNY